MARPRGGKNRVHDGDGEAPLRNSTDIDGDELLGYIQRIEQCNEEQKEISSDRQQIFRELKQAGYDRDTVRALVRRRKLTAEQRAAADALMADYRAALGDFIETPLGQAVADRMRGQAEDARVG